MKNITIKTIMLFFLLPLFAPAQNDTPIILYNTDILGGEKNDDLFGVKDFSEDGSIMVGDLNYFSNSTIYKAKIYQRDASGGWNQLGQSLQNINGYSTLTSRADLNASGNTVVLSTTTDNTYDYMINRSVKAFRYNGTSWEQLGQDIQSNVDFFFGGAKLNADGNKMAVQMRNISNASAGYDYVRIYEFNGTNWVQSGQDIALQNPGDRVSNLNFSRDGNMITFAGAKGSSAANSYVISYDYNGTAWVQKGQILHHDDMETASNKTFYAVRMSGDASTIAVHTSIPLADAWGAIYIYGWDASSNSWIQKGDSIIIYGQSEISISTNGKRIVTGNSGAYDAENGQSGDANGEARVFDYDPSSSSWSQIFFVQPWLKWGYVGNTVSISGNGAVFAYGQGYDGGSWFVSVYDFIEPTKISLSIANGADQYIHTGETVQLAAAVLPEDTANKQVEWNVESGTGFVSVDGTGLVTGIANGTAVIKATSVANPNISGSIQITVLDGEPQEEHTCSQAFNGEITNGGVIFQPNNYWTANDFDVPEGYTFTLKNISVPVISLGGAPIEYSVKIYKDSGTGPGEEIKAFPYITAVTQSITQDINYTYLVYSSTIDLGEGVSLAGGKKYWIALAASPTTQDKPLYWGMSKTSETQPTYQSTDGGSSWAVIDNAYDGVFTITGICKDILGIDDLAVQELTYYPNPVKDILNIRTGKAVGNVSVYNMAGQKVKAGLKPVNGQLNLSSLAAGSYIVHIASENGEIKAFKIIKQ